MDKKEELVWTEMYGQKVQCTVKEFEAYANRDMSEEIAAHERDLAVTLIGGAIIVFAPLIAWLFETFLPAK